MTQCRLLSEKGKPVDYRPAAQHHLFKQDGTFDFRYGAVRHCFAAIDRYMRHVFWMSHKSLFSKLLEDISAETLKLGCNLTFITTGKTYFKY